MPPHPQRTTARRCGRIVLAMVVALATVVVQATVAGADANTTLSESASQQVLYGNPSAVTLTAANPTGSAQFNATFADVLPIGVSYVPGSSTTGGTALTDPTVYDDRPAAGQTTVVWSNVGDLQPASSLTVSFRLQAQTGSGPHAGPDPILPGGTYTDATSVYVNNDPRTVPSFDATGAVVPGSYTDTATASGTTLVSPIEVSLSEPWPQGEALRGAHDHQYVNTLTVTNNPLYGVDATTATAFIPAGLEFLGCGGVDHTTDASGTNPGSTEEYPGSGSLDVSAPLAPATCPAPVSVVTVTDPIESDGTVLSGVFTEVTWNVGNLAPGAAVDIDYVTAIPLRSNTMVWSGATPPTTGQQGSNLDNNSGPETYDGEGLTTYVQTTGTYTGPPGPAGTAVSAKGDASVTAVDLAVIKSLSSTAFVPGQTVTVSLDYRTSEYRYSSSTVLTDTLPSGTCPVTTTTNYATDAGAAECAPSSSYVDPSVPFSSVVENPDGTFLVTWDLGTLPPDADHTITFTSLDRANYIEGGSPTAPVVAGDTLGDTSSITGTTNATCFTGTPSSPTADPDCSGSPTSPIYGGESTPGNPTRTSSAEQSAAQPTLTKQIAAPASPVDCATATYLASTDPDYPPTYQAGDDICFRLTMTFPAGVSTHNPTIYDLLPANSTLLSTTPTTANTVTIPGGDPTVSGRLLTWAVGESAPGSSGLFAGGGQTFQADIEITATAPPTAGNNFDLTGNLAEATATNTAGQGISLRDMATYNLSRPLVTLAKTSLAAGVPAPGQTVVARQSVAYQVTLTNTGLEPAQNVDVWDDLPSQVTGTAPDDCATLVDAAAAVPPATCATGNRLQWSGVSIPAATLVGGTLVPGTAQLTYSMTVPMDIAPGATLSNHAGVVSYQGPPPNTGGSPATFFPPTNIDPSAPADPTTTTPADDTTSVVTPSATATKSAATSVTEPGNDALTQATIGEQIIYTVSATVPAGTSVYNATLSDPLGPAGTGPLDVVAGTASATLDGGALPAGFTVTTSGNTPTVTFPAAYGPDLVSSHTVTLTFTAVVNDVAGSVAGTVLTNTASFDYSDSLGAPVTVPTPTVDTTVVEPLLSLTKSDSPGGPYQPGATVDYTVTASNGTGADVSTAHDLVVTDVLPSGMTPITGPVNSVSDGGVATESGGIWTITWSLPSTFTMAPGASKALTYDATLPSSIIGAASFTNSAGATITSLDTGSSPRARTTGSRYAATAATTVTTGGATIVKTATPATTTIGVDTTYTATVTIPANLEFPQATVIDTLPDGMVFDSYGAGTCVDAVAGPCGSDVAIAPIGTPSASGSGTTALAWSLGNIAPDAVARTITLTYTAHPAKSYTSTGAKVLHGQTLTNAVGAYWKDTDGPPPAGIPSPSAYTHASPTASAVVTVVEPQLTITKTSSTANPTPGVPFTYTVKVTNGTTNSSCAYDPTVTDVVPAKLTGVTNVTTAQGTASAAGNTITWTPSIASALCPLAAGLAPGAVATLTFQATLAASAGLTNGQAISNTATIAGYYGVDAATAIGTPARYVTYGPTGASVSVTPHFPLPVTAKTTPAGPAAFIGSPFTWSFTVTAPSPSAPAYSIGAKDTLPAYWTYDPGSTTVTPATGAPVTGAGADPTVSSSGAVQTLTWTGAQLADLALASQTITVTYHATPAVGANLGPSSANTNSVVATAADATGATSNASGAYHSNTATASAYIAAADLAMSKAVGTGGGLVAGSSGDYFTLGVTNNGPSPAAAPVVTDTVPNGAVWTFASASGVGWNCTTTPTTLTCSATAALASGATAPPIAAYITVPSNNGTTPVSNTASVASTTYDPDVANNTASVVAPVHTSADLRIVKAHVGALVPGTDGTYTLTVTNNGPSDADNPVVTDTLPSGLTFVSAAGVGWDCGNVLQAVTCSAVAPLASGATAGVITLTVSIASTTTGTIANTATVTSTTPDPNPVDNSSTDTTASSPMADLTITKTHIGPIIAGMTVTYQMTVTNNGPSDAADPVVTDALPSSLTYVSATGAGWACTAVAQVVTCTAGSGLPSGVTASTITMVTTLAPSATGTIANTAVVSSATADPVPGNNASTDTSLITTSADLAIVKTHTGPVTAGQDVSYGLSVSNAGPSDAIDPVVTDVLPAPLTFVSASGSGWTCTYDAASTTVTCTADTPLTTGTTAATVTLVATLASGFTGTLSNTATVTSPTPDPSPGDNTSTDATPAGTSADLAIVKTHDPMSPFTPGTIAVYYLAVTNLGPSDAADPTVVDVLPAPLSYVSATGSGWSASVTGQTVTLTASGPLTAGSAAPTVTVRVRVAPDYLGDFFSNTATVSSTTPDPDMANNSSTDSSPNPDASADLSIVKTGPASAVAGDQVSYDLAVSNAGPSDAATPTVTDVLPPDLAFVSATGVGWTCAAAGQTVTCDADGPLGTGTSAEPITLTAGLRASATTAISNTASVASTTADPDPANNSSTATTTVTTSADLTIAKTHTGDLLISHDAAYTLTVGNLGPSDAASPVVTDVLPDGLTYVSGSGDGWTCVVSAPTGTGQTVTCTAATPLAAGSTATPVTLTLAVGAAAYPAVTNSASVTSTTPDPVPGNNHASDPAIVDPLVDLQLTKTVLGTGPVIGGNELVFGLSVTNAGPTADPGPVVVTDPLPAGLTFVSASGPSWTCTAASASGAGTTGTQTVTCTRPGVFGVGLTSAITLTTTVTSDVATVVNTATVSSSATDQNPADNTSTATVPVVPGATLVLTKALAGGTLTSGQDATYDISVLNSGPAPASDVTVSDALPTGLGYVSAGGTGWVCTESGQAPPGQVVTCTLSGDLAVGSSAQFTVVVHVTAGSGSIANTADVSSSTSLSDDSVTRATTAAVLVAPPVPGGGSGGGSGGSSGQPLAYTGADLVALLLAGGLLLLTGGLLSRRRRQPDRR